MRNTRSFAALAAAPWLAFSASAAYRAWLHWQTMFPFGAGGFCGQAVPHCGWCGLAIGGLFAAAGSFALAGRQTLSPSAVKP